MSHKVAVAAIEDGQHCSYSSDFPYHPDEIYPEYPFGEALSSQPNIAYKLVREAFKSLGYDQENYGTKNWNPLGHVVKPGMRVAIKPNFVLSRHNEGGDVWSIITHPSVLRVVADYCFLAMEGRGTIEFAEAPQYNCNFEELMELTKLEK